MLYDLTSPRYWHYVKATHGPLEEAHATTEPSSSTLPKSFDASNLPKSVDDYTEEDYLRFLNNGGVEQTGKQIMRDAGGCARARLGQNTVKVNPISGAGVAYACRYCRAFDKRVQACAACGEAHYCSGECQKADWQSHKQRCKEVRQQKQNSDDPQRAHTTPRDNLQLIMSYPNSSNIINQHLMNMCDRGVVRAVLHVCIGQNTNHAAFEDMGLVNENDVNQLDRRFPMMNVRKQVGDLSSVPNLLAQLVGNMLGGDGIVILLFLTRVTGNKTRTQCLATRFDSRAFGDPIETASKASN
jgi:hypothetical protein